MAQGHTLQKSQDAMALQLASQSTQLRDLTLWKPDLEERLAKLQDTVADLQRERLSTSAATGGPASASVDNTIPATHHGDVHGQFGHGDPLSSGGLSMVDSPSPSAPPVTGMFSFQVPLAERSSDPNFLASQIMAGMGANAPTMPFPPFSGDNPNLWKTLAEQYFQLFTVHDSYWVAMSILHFSGAAGIWLQSIQKKLVALDWLSFTSLLCTRFGRDRHQLLIRQFYTIKQTSTVAEYIERFDILMNHLASYSDTTHPFYFLTRFIEGLRADIRAVIMVQRPLDLDTACSLALLQEEVADGEHSSPPSAMEHRYVKLPSRSFFQRQHNSPNTPIQGAADSRGIDSSRAATNEKITALRNYRRAKGLCYKCGERWGQEHVCPATVQMHVVEELLALFTQDELAGPEVPKQDSEEADTICSLSIHALRGTTAEASGVIQLHAYMAGQEVLILVDSGSSASFINKHLEDKMTGAQQLQKKCLVKVADGTQHRCSTFLPDRQWSSQGATFHTDLKILPLGSFDAILGMDWLEEHNPNIDWVLKTLSIQSAQGTVLLQGHCSHQIQCSAISATELSNLCRQNGIANLIHIYALDGTVHTEEVAPDEIESLLSEFPDVFDSSSNLPPRRDCDHRIPLMPGAQPVNMRAYRHKPELKTEIERQVTELLESGIIQRSTSQFSSPAILVRKKDGTWRLCVDYRRLNAMTVVSKYPVPIIDELLDELAGARWFSKLDLRAGYHQIRLAPGEEFKTAFQTHSGHWEYKVMPFGLAGAPATFLGAMNTTLRPLLRKCVIVFFDDILVYSNSLADHMIHLKSVLQLLRQDSWQVKRSKCSFGQQRITYLGHVIDQHGVSSDPDKIAKVASWPTPQNSKDVRSFLGLAGYYRKFVQHFGIVARPLFNLLKKHTPFQWTAETETAFQVLKQKLIQAPVLQLPDFAKTFLIDTDACDTGVGAVLQQDGHPIAYMSKPLGPRNMGLSTYEKECLAVLMAIEQWRPYLQHREFMIRTDQRSLVHLDDQRLTTIWQQKAFTKLLGLQYKISYRKGPENNAADALSCRHHNDTLSLLTISTCQPAWLEEIKQSYATNEHASKWITKLQHSPDSKGRFSLEHNLLYFRKRIWLGGSPHLQEKIMAAFHTSKIGGHSGFPATYCRLKKLFAWPKMKQQIKEFVQSCFICQQAKPERVKYPGLLQPLPTPDAAWKIVTMDFIEGLPTSGMANSIMVVVDKFTHYAHFIPLHHPFSAAKVAAVYLDNVVKLHSLREVMVSDRDPIFTSKFWKELFSRMGSELRMSSAYHPQTDGQSERVNQCVEIYLRCFTHATPHKWSQYLSLAEYWYNTSYHSAIKMSPFVALYGREPRHWGIDSSATCTVPSLEEWLAERQLMQQLLQHNLHFAKQQMKVQADKKRTERTFTPRDEVFIKL